ncbi:MAG: GNAT family N-acetyltransferase [archaeon]
MDLVKIVHLNRVLAPALLFTLTSQVMYDSLVNKFPQVKEILLDSNRSVYLPKTISATIENVPVGGLIWTYDDRDDSLVVKYLGVNDNFRNHGIGKMLMDEAEKIAFTFDSPRIQTETIEPRGNEQNLPLWYAHRGFNLVNRVYDPIHGRNNVILQKEIRH